MLRLYGSDVPMLPHLSTPKLVRHYYLLALGSEDHICTVAASVLGPKTLAEVG